MASALNGTGSRLLAYCLPLKKLHITGKDWKGTDIVGKELDAVLEAGALSREEYPALPTDQLLKKLESWSPVVRHLLQVRNGASRSAVATICDKLSEKQLKPLWKDIMRATRELAPSGIMFADGVQTAGLRLMAKHRTREGLETAAWYLTNQKLHGGDQRTKAVLDIIVKGCGGHAKAVIPRLEFAIGYFEQQERPGRDGKRPRVAMVREAIEAAPTPSWKMTSIAEYL